MSDADFLPLSAVRDDDGTLRMLYRGDYRARAIASGFRIFELDADGGSGGLYFTDNRDIASNYADTKPFYEDGACDAWLHVHVSIKGRRVELRKVAPLLSRGDRERIRATALMIDGECGYEGKDKVVSAFTCDEYLRRSRGDVVRGMTDLLFQSGLLGVEEFVEFWRRTGVFEDVAYDDPYQPEAAVTPVYLDIRSPLDMARIPEGLADRIAARIGADDGCVEFLRAVDGAGETVTYLTPEFRQALLDEGFDGIKDVGGVITGGERHTVWIALSPDQIAPAYGPEAVAYRQAVREARREPETGRSVRAPEMRGSALT